MEGSWKIRMILGSQDPVERERSLDEINATLPRKVRLYSDERPKLLIISVVVLAVVAVWIGYYRYYATKVQQRELLRVQGRQQTGEVTELLSSKGGTYVHYTFRVELIWYEGEAKLPEDPQAGVTVRHPILVRYLTTDPSVNHPDAWEWSLGWDIVPILWILLLTGAGSAVAISSAVALLRERALIRKGWVVDGKVTACAPNRSKFSVDYEFHTENKTVVEGSDSYSNSEYEVGSRIRVIYLRDHPQTNAFYPASSFYVVY